MPITPPTAHWPPTPAAARRGTGGISTSFGGVQIFSQAPRISQRDAFTPEASHARGRDGATTLVIFRVIG
jgi:hypothetical protein